MLEYRVQWPKPHVAPQLGRSLATKQPATSAERERSEYVDLSHLPLITDTINSARMNPISNGAEVVSFLTQSALTIDLEGNGDLQTSKTEFYTNAPMY